MGFIDLDKIIDIDDITDLEKLGDLQIDLDDIFGEISDEELIEEFKERELEGDLEIEAELSDFSISEIANHLSQLPSYKLRDLFCDMVGVNHHTPKDELMKLLSERI
ncbi:MAG: hypothetical protein ACK5LF_21420 [Bacteroides xylanisolvens]